MCSRLFSANGEHLSDGIAARASVAHCDNGPGLVPGFLFLVALDRIAARLAQARACIVGAWVRLYVGVIRRVRYQ